MENDLPSNLSPVASGDLTQPKSGLQKFFTTITWITILLLTLLFLTLALEWGVTSRTPFGIDFFVYWLNGRILFLDGQSPYTLDAAQQAQLGLYGRLAQPGEDPKGFVYPPYSLLAIWPTIWLPYPRAFALWLAANFLLLMLALRFSFPKLPLWIAVGMPFFYPIARGLVMGQFAVLIGIIFLTLYGLTRPAYLPKPKLQFSLGLVLAWLTIKPQLTWLFILFFLLKGLRARYWSGLAGFVAGLLLLGGLSWLLLPGWPWQLLHQLINGSDELSLGRPLAYIYVGWLVPGPLASVGGTILLIAGCLIVVFVCITWWQGRLSAITALAWCAFITQLLHPLNMPPEQILFLLPLLAWSDQQLSEPDLPANSRSTSLALIIVWSLVLALPYLILMATFDIVESPVVTAMLPLCFLGWLLWSSKLTLLKKLSP